jgi:hypothetical protein
MEEGKCIICGLTHNTCICSNRQKRFTALLQEAKENGFSEEQASWLINLLDDFIPLV